MVNPEGTVKFEGYIYRPKRVRTTTSQNVKKVRDFVYRQEGQITLYYGNKREEKMFDNYGQMIDFLNERLYHLSKQDLKERNE